MCPTTSSRRRVHSQSRFPDLRRESTTKISGETTPTAEDPKGAAAAVCYHKPADLRCSSVDSVAFAPAEDSKGNITPVNEDDVDSGSLFIEGARGSAWADKSDRPERKPSDCGESNRSDGKRRVGAREGVVGDEIEGDEYGEGFKAEVPAGGDVVPMFVADTCFAGPGTMRSVVVEPGHYQVGGIVGGVSGFDHGDSHGEGGDAWSEGSELTLGRPKSSSIHWKYCRRLLQT